jgi:hypothetical protein
MRCHQFDGGSLAGKTALPLVDDVINDVHRLGSSLVRGYEAGSDGPTVPLGPGNSASARILVPNRPRRVPSHMCGGGNWSGSATLRCLQVPQLQPSALAEATP